MRHGELFLQLSSLRTATEAVETALSQAGPHAPPD